LTAGWNTCGSWHCCGSAGVACTMTAECRSTTAAVSNSSVQERREVERGERRAYRASVGAGRADTDTQHPPAVSNQLGGSWLPPPLGRSAFHMHIFPGMPRRELWHPLADAVPLHTLHRPTSGGAARRVERRHCGH
jgi:hypothetical protein